MKLALTICFWYELSYLAEELEAQLKADGKQPKKKNRKKYKRNVTRDIGVLVTGCQAHERSSDCKRGKQ